VLGAASIGVIRVDTEEELQKAYERVVKDMSRAKVGVVDKALACHLSYVKGMILRTRGVVEDCH
jgi:hypothetical protein